MTVGLSRAGLVTELLVDPHVGRSEVFAGDSPGLAPAGGRYAHI
jgi:hypothetical protein